MNHELKIDEPMFRSIVNGLKKFEIRLNDRHYQELDTLTLKVWDKINGYSGEYVTVLVRYILRDTNYGLLENHVCMSIEVMYGNLVLRPVDIKPLADFVNSIS